MTRFSEQEKRVFFLAEVCEASVLLGSGCSMRFLDSSLLDNNFVAPYRGLGCRAAASAKARKGRLCVVFVLALLGLLCLF